ncbi:hypothetical protein HBH56_118970 [Parastagonospora nodorum]|uniref:Uncharacterized protein n=1 Tax=Phaeosphaeria nodorum (strain SN15 / ATCC MYA-4574 / FGSC 10173) TaxID=321614 RepID=A0A7U2I8S1_PHANO|nr:hypothetical protein HBH56_118970 [Parastagonospora nodorum]QRD05335.1 hypothetical protein JI435_422310 [Parastagonospora nodorum SN15]KAH3928740.1 hypothetical protein HBH54_130230 [Parastagonospora nodorum]KAH3959845.1 hypothetical protein HBH51_197360 [Parastagonospora nodorum]KAH3998698.1 hypothetical protein HBI10_128260 [Parastagonospora nodorum]
METDHDMQLPIAIQHSSPWARMFQVLRISSMHVYIGASFREVWHAGVKQIRIYILDSVADAILPQSDFDKLDDASGLLHCQRTWPKTRPVARLNLMKTRCIFEKRYDMTWLLLAKSRPLLDCADPPRLWPTRTL